MSYDFWILYALAWIVVADYMLKEPPMMDAGERLIMHLLSAIWPVLGIILVAWWIARVLRYLFSSRG